MRSICAVGCAGWFLNEYVASEQRRRIKREVLAVHYVAKSHSRPSATGILVLPRQSDTVLESGVPIRCSSTKSDFVWTFAPDSDVGISLRIDDVHNVRFFAVSRETTADGERIFIIQAPLYGVILRDEEVDWKSRTIARGKISGPL